MSQHRLARIRWLSKQEGGRPHFPSGSKYCSVAKFEDYPNWREESWSVVAFFRDEIDENGVVLADVALLVPDSAPENLLKIGSSFELLEGAKPVAQVKVIG